MGLPDDHVDNVCRRGQGADCCRYVTISGDGYGCEKFGPLHAHIDQKAALGQMGSVGDNCPGWHDAIGIWVANPVTQIRHDPAPVGAAREDLPPGSISSLDPSSPAGRQVYLFGFIDGEAGAWRSMGGFDVETPELRMVSSTEGLEPLGLPVEVEIRTPGGGIPTTVRFDKIEGARHGR